MKTLLLVDGNALVHRAYHALPAFKTHKGIPTNAVYGFATMLHRAIEDFKPTHIVVCFDTAAPTFRDELYKEYRTQRPKAEDTLIAQFPLVHELLDEAAIKSVEKDGFEADDLIGILASVLSPKTDRVLIMTGDKDIFQLITDKVSVVTPQIGFAQSKLYNSKEVYEKFGVKPDQVADLKALAGDSSDNYKGVPGIGPKTAAHLLKKFGTLDNLYKNLDKVESEKVKKTLETNKDKAFLSKKLATIVTHDHLSIKLDECTFDGYNEKLRGFFDKLEFRSLQRRFFKEARNPKSSEKKVEKKEEKNQLGLF